MSRILSKSGHWNFLGLPALFYFLYNFEIPFFTMVLMIAALVALGFVISQFSLLFAKCPCNSVNSNDGSLLSKVLGFCFAFFLVSPLFFPLETLTISPLENSITLLIASLSLQIAIAAIGVLISKIAILFIPQAIKWRLYTPYLN